MAMVTAMAGVASAHHGGGADGHVPANTNYGFEAVGYSSLAGVQDGRYSDVWAHEGFAYVGSFQDPDCSTDGVHIADISDPTDPTYVGQIHSNPNTRVNDVKVTEVGGRDVLIFTHELCGRIVAATQASDGGIEHGKPDGSGTIQQGKEGISLYDVSNPLNPKPLARGFLDTEVHNTYPWTNEEGRTFLLVVDDLNINDTWIVEITNPKKPKLLVKTGIGDWLDQGIFDLETSELFLGTFAAPLLHDVWVEYNPTTERFEGVLSYWDAGFITLDLSDPANPVVIDESDYPETDPVLGDFRDAPEGNAHAAVFGGDDNQFIFGGDEDFDVLSTAVTVAGESYIATTGSDTPAVDETGLTGTPVFVGLACDSSVPDAPDASSIAIIERGVCAFTTKATEITAAGYAAGVVFNGDAADRCDASVSMSVEGTVPMLFVPRSAGFAILGVPYDGSSCGDGSTASQLPPIGHEGADDATVSAVFDGWGYLWVLNNSGADMDVSDQNPPSGGSPSPDTTVGPMGTVGFYAPAEVADPALASGAGDLTMHNLETDLENRERMWVSWYALGMRALEWREGHWHTNANGEGSYSWNVHEVGRWIASEEDPTVIGFAEDAGVDPSALNGSNFWGVTQTVIDGTRYILGSDRNTGLWIFEYQCDDPDGSGPLYCGSSNETGTG